jgi:hypothetical protein
MNGLNCEYEFDWNDCDGGGFIVLVWKYELPAACWFGENAGAEFDKYPPYPCPCVVFPGDPREPRDPMGEVYDMGDRCCWSGNVEFDDRELKSMSCGCCCDGWAR